MNTITAETKKDAVNKIIAMFKEFNTSFVGLRDYTNDKGEVSDYVINVGIKHGVVLSRDLVARLPKIKAEHFLLYSEKYGENVALQAFNEKQISMEKSLTGTNDRAIAQIESYVQIVPGVKMHIESGDFFITGYVISKKVKVKGVYKEVKSRPLTLCKKEIDKAGLKAGKYRQFKIAFDKLVEVVTGGKVLEMKLAA